VKRKLRNFKGRALLHGSMFLIYPSGANSHMQTSRGEILPAAGAHKDKVGAVNLRMKGDPGMRGVNRLSLKQQKGIMKRMWSEERLTKKVTAIIAKSGGKKKNKYKKPAGTEGEEVMVKGSINAEEVTL